MRGHWQTTGKEGHRNWGWAWRAVFSQWVLLLFCASLAHAQLAQSFINVTRITTKKLPNAVQIRIETDGSAQYGTDLHDFVNLAGGFYPTPTQNLRIRILRARSKLPAFVPIEAYPVDGAVVSLGTEDFANPQFADGSDGKIEPRVQVELRFATPVIIREFASDTYSSVDFGDYLGPLEARVEPSPDRRAIIITVITDRADATAPERLDRSPLAGRQHKLSVEDLGNGRFRMQALHTPLRDLMENLAAKTGVKFLVRDQISGLDVSMVLPDGTLQQFLEALQVGYGIGSRAEGETTVLSRGDEFYASRTLQLHNLTPEKARLLFPDFLLPFLRAQRESNALLAVQTLPMLDKISADLSKLDTPRAQFEIKVEAWEIASTLELNQTLALTRSVGGDIESLNLGTGTSSIRVENGLTAQLGVTLNALAARGRARLVASPHVTALSGEAGNIFLGQTRYIKILQNRNGGQTAQALPLQIGTTLGVTPRGNNSDGEVLLSVSPRVSTVDEIEPSTGLPTLGIREISSQVRVKANESLVLAGLDFDFSSKLAGKTLKIIPSKRESRDLRRLLVLVSARRVSVN